MDWRSWARVAQEGRQERSSVKLVASQVSAAQQKQVVEAALILSGFLLTVVPKLVTAKRVHDFTLPPGQLEVLAAGVSKSFRLCQLSFQHTLAFDENGMTKLVKLQFRCTDTGFQLRAPAHHDIFHSCVRVFDFLPQPGNPLIRFLQPQLMLPLEALPHSQKHFERESEGHKSQLGSASSRSMLSLSLTASLAPCSRKRFSPGKTARAWSSSGSLPFWYAPMRIRSSDAP